MKLKIARIILFVKDVAMVAEFYRDIIGLKVIGKINSEWTELETGSCNIALHKASKSGLKNSKKNDSAVKIVFESKNVQKEKLMLEAKGCKIGKIFTYEGMSFCDGSDPEGNRFQISDR